MCFSSFVGRSLVVGKRVIGDLFQADNQDKQGGFGAVVSGCRALPPWCLYLEVRISLL